MKTKFRITNKKHAFIAAVQSQAAKEFALFKSRRQFKHEPSEKTAYKPGSLGPSVVATAIIKEYGGIIPRSLRKAKAKRTGKPFIKFYSHQ
ncbi:hypothetical protein BSK66_31715 [Paenibacillus odorifer]|uniref:hypothetical protein n=1 Tax=Paenibacillus TaxID=44249 RepID=UPI0003E2B2B9|nr:MULTISPECIES: hypothetical protein [Paenibacillus]ETT46239.1 hypothetical protein C171_28327 [Paenibacillus sp. FSL H8-237]OME46661.1 hypothetical protein BSK66_31715 [Paenibacillus odorifer]